jgi:phosphomannomutase
MADEPVPSRVVVVYDTRAHSQHFAKVVAEQLAANDIEVILVDAPRPTPQLSFLVRARGCGGGVVISASHNPPEDNGIKVYGPDGAQVIGALASKLMQCIERAMDRPLPPVTAAHRTRIQEISGPDLVTVDRPYIDFVLAQGVNASDLGRGGLKVVFTPLHGVGHTSVLPVLRARGALVHPVEAQCDPDDGRFSTVRSANPEVPHSMELAASLARDIGADLVMATDPDADRLGALARRSPDADLEFMNGNSLGALMLDHVLSSRTPPEDGWVLSTMVTTPLVSAIARAHGVDVVDDLLVGFKHHAGMMEEQPDRPLVLAAEESHGYLRGNEVRDKDGAIGALLLTECAVAAGRRGKTLFDEVERLWREHGYHLERASNIFARGTAGREAIAAVMTTWREQPPARFGDLDVASMEDRLEPRHTGSTTRDLRGDVLCFELEGRENVTCRLVVRPSGTEPKLKLYALGRSAGKLDDEGLARAKADVTAVVGSVIDDASARAEATMAATTES